MTTFHFEVSHDIRRPRVEVFDFFSDAANLEAITPPWLKFHVVTPLPIAMREGTLIDYRLRVHGLPLRWRTRIHIWDPPKRFVDEQLRGPYRLWHHEHVFEEVPGGTRVHDRVRYSPLGGTLINRLFVRRDVEAIFAFRKAKLERLLNLKGESDSNPQSTRCSHCLPSG